MVLGVLFRMGLCRLMVKWQAGLFNFWLTVALLIISLVCTVVHNLVWLLKRGVLLRFVWQIKRFYFLASLLT